MDTLQQQVDRLAAKVNALIIGTNIEAWDADLDALAALGATAGLLARTGAGAFSPRTLQAGAGISISNPAGTAADPTITCTVTGVSTLAALTDVAAQTVSQVPNGSAAIDLGSAAKLWRVLYTAGIAFGHETMTDYDEGTWTPTLVPGTSGTITLGTTAARFIRLGNFVAAWGYLPGSASNVPVGNLTLGGLPFTVGNSNGNYAACFVIPRGWAVSLTSTVGLLLDKNATTGTFYKYGATGGMGAVAVADWANGGDVFVLCLYSIA